MRGIYFDFVPAIAYNTDSFLTEIYMPKVAKRTNKWDRILDEHMPKSRREASRWSKIPKGNYRVVDAGRPAVFLLPIEKLGLVMPGGVTVQDSLHEFFAAHFTGYAFDIKEKAGFYFDGKTVVYDKCFEYKVSFIGKAKIRLLFEKLAEIAMFIKGKCIYVEAGQYSAFLFPLYPPGDRK